MSDPICFDYDQAFSRNIGWLTPWEQQILRSKTIAIAGVGGVGGGHLLSLVRLGFQNFHIADFDRFELNNFNRQAGAMMSTVGKQKVDVLSQMAKDINPQAQIKIFPDGVHQGNIEEFFQGVDLYVDGLDAFVLDIRGLIFDHCYKQKIPAVTAAPLGMSTAYLVFMPGQMTFEDYFCLQGQSKDKQSIHFFMGLEPQATQGSYLMDKSRINLKEQRGPSTSMACQLASGVVGVEVVKIMLGRGKVYAAPWRHVFDPYLNRWSLKRLNAGNKNFIQQIRIAIAYKSFFSKKRIEEPPNNGMAHNSSNELEQILDLARWAPSGDNAQCWKFEIKGDQTVVVDVCSDESVYDYGNKPLHLTIGLLLESMAIAASGFNRGLHWQYSCLGTNKYRIEVEFPKQSMAVDPLLPFVKVRTVNRGAYKIKPLSLQQKLQLEQSLSEDLQIQWFESFSSRLKMSGLLARATDIRLSIKETYATHKKILDFEHKFSKDRVPAASLGASALTVKLMRWAMADWRRLDFLNKFLMGTMIPQIEMDYVPGVCCSAFYTISFKTHLSEDEPKRLIGAGRALQRFWLSLTQMGLSMQPSMAPLAFSYYADNNIPFTQNQAMPQKAKKLSGKLAQMTASHHNIFMGRIGFPKSTHIASRSVRKELSQLIKI